MLFYLKENVIYKIDFWVLRSTLTSRFLQNSTFLNETSVVVYETAAKETQTKTFEAEWQKNEFCV